MSNERPFPHDSDLDSVLLQAVLAVRSERIPEDAVMRVGRQAVLLSDLPNHDAAPHDLAAAHRRNGRGEPASRLFASPGLGASSETKSSQASIFGRFVMTQNGRTLLVRIARLAGVAAALALLLIGAVWMTVGGGSNVVLADVIRNAVEAKSVTFVLRETVGKTTLKEFNCLLEGDSVRIESPRGMVLVEDLKRWKGIFLDKTNKEAAKWDVPEGARDELRTHPIKQLQQAKPEDAKFLRDELLKGRKSQVFRVKVASASFFNAPPKESYGFAPDLEMTIWVEPQNQLPLKIEIRQPGEPFAITFDQMKWNESLDAALFLLEIPAGYTEQPAEQLRARWNQTDPNAKQDTGAPTPQEAFRNR